MKLKVIFSLDPTGMTDDSVEIVEITLNNCLYCLHDKENRLVEEVKLALDDLGYNVDYYCEIMKIYAI